LENNSFIYCGKHSMFSNNRILFMVQIELEKCPYCQILRDELYMGGGLYVYTCPKCNSRMEVKQ
jgi:Zn finger protein HypA/HybF involved in hydrogenase expression